MRAKHDSGIRTVDACCTVMDRGTTPGSPISRKRLNILQWQIKILYDMLLVLVNFTVQTLHASHVYRNEREPVSEMTISRVQNFSHELTL